VPCECLYQFWIFYVFLFSSFEPVRDRPSDRDTDGLTDGRARRVMRSIGRPRNKSCRNCISDEEYVRRQLREDEESGDSMKSLRWDGATLRKASNARRWLVTVLCWKKKLAVHSAQAVLVEFHNYYGTRMFRMERRGSFPFKFQRKILQHIEGSTWNLKN